MQNSVSDRLSCSKCGRIVRWNDSYCSACGAKIELAKDASIDLPQLSRSVPKSELWGKTIKTSFKVKTDVPDLSVSFSPVQEARRTEVDSLSVQEERRSADSLSSQEEKRPDYAQKPQNHARLSKGRANTSRLKYRRNSSKLSFGLFVLVLLELFAFCPYVFVVLCVFKYNVFCDVLAISGAAVLLTHGVCVFASYVVALIRANRNREDETLKAVENTRRLLTVGAGLLSIFLLAFVVCLVCNDSAALQPKTAEKYTPVSFDD